MELALESTSGLGSTAGRTMESVTSPTADSMPLCTTQLLHSTIGVGNAGSGGCQQQFCRMVLVLAVQGGCNDACHFLTALDLPLNISMLGVAVYEPPSRSCRCAGSSSTPLGPDSFGKAFKAASRRAVQGVSGGCIACSFS